MTGERLAWHRVAAHLHCTVEELAGKITVDEFNDWLDFIVWEEKRKSKLDFYLAQIAFQIVRGNAKNPNQVKMADYFHQFEEKGPVSGMDSKKVWLSALGIKNN